MSSKTTNLNLTKPSEDEFYDINVQNENMDIIDREINGLKQPAYKVSTAMSDLNSGEMITVAFGKIAKAVSTLISHVANKSNPHGVTKNQIGLENVPNVATNDQTPTYTEASSLSSLVSGEKTSVAFGKIAKAVSTLISHTTSKATNSVLGHVKLSDSTSSTSASTAGVAATPKAVKAAYDLANSNTEKLGTTDISGIGDGTVTGAIAENKDAIEDVTQSLTIINENLIPYPYHETTRMINGVTFIDNGDGTITANGTATDDLIFWIKYFNDLEIDDNIKYTISGSPNGSSSGKYCLSARVYTKKDAPSPSSGKIIRVSQAGTVVTGYKYIAPYISVWKGVTLNNVIFKPMLEYGTVASDYKQYSMSNAGLQEQIEMCKENLIPFPYCATSTGSYAKSFNSSSLTTVEAKNDGSLLIGSNGKIPSKTNQVLFRLIHDNFENIPLYNDIYSMDPHFENRPSASGVALAVSFERAKDSELETFYVTSPVEINNIDGKYTKIKYISVWLSTATASFENVKMKPTITRGGITEKRDVVSQKLSMDAIVARTRNSLNIVHLPLKETKTLTLAQLYNSYAKQNDVLYVTVIDYSDSKSYKSSTMLLFIDDFQIYAISTEGLLKYDNVNDKWAVIIPRA